MNVPAGEGDITPAADSGQVLTGAHFIPTLDGWRAVAIGAVIVCHLAVIYTENSVFIHLGAQGVALFFAISGFLITTRLLIEHERSGTIALRSFYIRRAFRILPPALAYLLTLYVLSLLRILALHHGELVSAIFFFSNYWPDRSWFTAHFWSLSIEEHFYFMWPAALLLLGPARVKWLAAAVIAGTWIWRPFGVAADPAVPPFERTDMRLDAFMFACLLAILMRDRRAGPRLHGILSNPALRVAVLLSLAIAYSLAMEFPGWRMVKEAAQSAFIPLLIGGTVARPKDWIGRKLDSAPLKVVGRLSYGLYLWQELFLTGVILLNVVSKLVLLFAVVTLSYYGFEKRCMDLGRRLSGRRGGGLSQG
jgi:peptidoglycan/LPS O-acetylase OafA/YrhL